VKDFGRLVVEMEDLWLQTRPWSPAEYQIVEAGRRFRREAGNWLQLDALAEQFRASRKIAGRRWAWFMSRWPMLSTTGLASRQHLAKSWERLRAQSPPRRWLGFNPARAALTTARELRLAMSFVCALVAQS
jgi:hypothetical protein